MKQKQLALAFAATLLAGGTAFAAAPTNAEYYPFQEATLVKTTGANTGAASTTNSNTTKMGATGGVTTDDQSRQILMYLKAGG